MSASADPTRDDSAEQETLENEQESLEDLFGTVFELADQLTSRISPAEIEARLQRTLQEANREIPDLVAAAENVEVRTLLPYRPVSASLAIAPTVSVIIPARNEAANLPHVFGTLPSWVDEVIVVDGHSTDDTVAVTRALLPYAKVIAQPAMGKGDALLAGFAAASGDIIVTIDADGSTDGAEIAAFVGALVAGADFAKGSRFSSSGCSDDITAMRRAGNRVLNLLVNRLFRTRFTDLSYGYNAFWARHLGVLRLQRAGFEVHTLMYIRASKAGLKIQEIPSYQRPRISGTSNVHVGRDGWQMLKLIFRERFSRKREPDRRGLPPHGASHHNRGHERDMKGSARDLAARFHPRPHRPARAT
jgi:glycosyltransferase involved in cell wall biosynthesis